MTGKLVAVIDPPGLALLVNRLVRLRCALEAAAAERNHLLKQASTATEANEEVAVGCDEGFALRAAARHQLEAVLEFIEDSETLAPELHKLLYALIDFENGREVAWLRRPPPSKSKGQPRPPSKDAMLHGRFGEVMDWLMNKGGMKKQEAAEFVVTHGHIRQRLGKSTRASKAAHPWKTVSNWRDRARSSGPSSEGEREGFRGMYEIIDGRQFKCADADVQTVAKNLLRAIRIYFSLG